jgi:hypothetical protein
LITHILRFKPISCQKGVQEVSSYLHIVVTRVWEVPKLSFEVNSKLQKLAKKGCTLVWRSGRMCGII